jgi:ubiquinone/menaquinone biosynthesis C-methylase UbiE
MLEAFCMQQHVYRQLSELMGGMLPRFVVPTRGTHVLDIGWGMGESVYELALKYPASHIIGIDRDESTVTYAQSLVSGLSNVSVYMQKIPQFDDTLLTPASCDLIYLHFLAGEITLQQFPQLFLSLSRFLRPGGFLVWTEAELPITTSLAFQRLCSLLLQALRVRKYIQSQGNSVGLTALMGNLLSEAGYICTHSKAYAIDISSSSRGNKAFLAQLSISRLQICAFLLELGLLTISEFEDLYAEMQQEIREEHFCGLLYIRTVIAKRI